MNASLRTSLLLGIVVGLSAVAGCRESKPTTDILAEDSSLAVAVLSANQDTVSLADADTLSIEPVTAPIAAPKPAEIAAQPAPITTEPAPPSALDRSIALAPKSVSVSSSDGASERRVTPSTRTVSKRTVRRSNASGIASAPRRATARTANQSGRVRRSPLQLAAGSNRPVDSYRRIPMRATAMIPAGSELVFSASEKVCSASGTVGDRFIAETAEDVIGPLGVVIPKGSVASGEIVSRSKNPRKQDAVLRIQSLKVNGRTYNVSSEVTDAQLDNVRTGSKAAPAKVIAGAGIGAILGRILGGSTQSTVIGATGGAAAGGVVASRSKRTDRCIPVGGRINARLTEPLRVSLTE